MKIRDRIKELRRVPASALRPNPKNWRTHPKEQADALRGTLAEIGFAEAVVARELPDGSLELIDGHLRAETVGDAEVPVLVLDVTEDEADKLLVTLDPLAAMATVDAEALASLVETVETDSKALRQMIDDLASDAGIDTGAEVVEDEVPEVPVDPITKPGDLWLLGEHRVLCGDSTKAEDVERVMGGEKAAVCISDPPYGINASVSTSDERIIGDESTNTRDMAIRLCASLPMILFGSWKAPRPTLKIRGLLIWSKGPFVGMGDLEFPWALTHEEIYVIGDGFKGKREDSVIAEAALFPNLPAANNARGEDLVHPTQKPIKLLAGLIHKSPEGTIYDPFLGSGTTLIAAEQLGRRCFGMEISPAYCDVIVKRWETLTGKKATLAA